MGDITQNGLILNGNNRSRTPSLNSLSLTEYSSRPPPASQSPMNDLKRVVPDEYLLPNGYPDYLRLILTSRVYEVVDETPLTHAINLSNRLECKVLLKREDLQPVFSFKLRGAYNKIAHLSPEVSWKGVVACSAGNHAQGVAYSARKLKIPATVVMPQSTPSIKHLNVSRMGATVVLHGENFDAAKEECARLEKIHSLTNIPPFDDPYVIAGQGTIGMELLRQTNLQKLEVIFCCVGGGGLIAGIGTYVKRLAPHVKIIGVETFDANAMIQSLSAGERVLMKDVGLFADGAAVRKVGEETFRLCKEVVDEIIQVTTDETCAAIKDIFEDTRSIVEPAGALALAGLKKYVSMNPSADTNRQLVAIASGANMNFDRLRFIAERAALGEKKEVFLSVSIPESLGSFAELIKRVMPHMVTELTYRYSTEKIANILIGISLVSPALQREQELDSLLSKIRAGGMTAIDLSSDELAKSHIRYLAGGRSDVANERLYTFNFPERLGALEKFLTILKPKYNISAFQYRNTGSDIGKVLVGILCPQEEVKILEEFFKMIGYRWEDCTQSNVFRTFMRMS